MWEMTRLTRIRTDRRRVLAGGAALFAGTVAFHKAGAQSAIARGPEHAIFTEFSPESKLLKAGWNTRVFTHTDARRGNGIQCDFVTGIITLAPGSYHFTGVSVVAYMSGGEPAEMTTVRAPASAGYCRLRTVGSSRVLKSGYARRRQRRPQCHLHRKPEHREPHCERVRSVSGNRQDRRNGAGTSIGKQSGANLLAGLHPEFPMACDGQNRHSECVTNRVECSSASRDRAPAQARTSRICITATMTEAPRPSASLADLQLLVQLPVRVDPASVRAAFLAQDARRQVLRARLTVAHRRLGNAALRARRWRVQAGCGGADRVGAWSKCCSVPVPRPPSARPAERRRRSSWRCERWARRWV